MSTDNQKKWPTAVFALGLICGSLSGIGHATASPNSTLLLAGGCNICHGPNGVSSGPATPTIAGLSGEYLLSTLEGFKSGEIPSTIMGRITRGYSSDELQALANHYSSRPFSASQQPYDPRLARQGAKLHNKYCEKCHTEGGSSAEEGTGRLAGQWRPWLIWALQDFRSGRRLAGRKMQQQLDKLYIRKGKRGLTALLHYYASQQP